MRAERYEIAIVGAGAAGLACAVESSLGGLRRIVILEKNDRPGRKVLLSGAGRCNLGNARIGASHYPLGGRWLSPEFFEMDGTAVRSWFADIGLATEVDGRGRVFPVTGRASTVVELMTMTLREAGVDLRCRERVISVRSCGPGFEIVTTRGTIRADNLVLSTGGRSHPSTGSAGDGYGFADGLGLPVTPVVPALVPVEARLGRLHRLQGCKWRCGLRLSSGDGRFDRAPGGRSSQGDVMFTGYGLSGLAVLDLTARAGRMSLEDASVSVDFFPDLPPGSQALTRLLRKRSSRFPSRGLAELVKGLLPEKMIPVLLEHLGAVSGDGGGLDIESAAVGLRRLNVPLKGRKGWDRAQVTAGGVELDSVDASSFRARDRTGLYVIGELLDVHGLSGGYNLHFAWVSGILSARDILRRSSVGG